MGQKCSMCTWLKIYFPQTNQRKTLAGIRWPHDIHIYIQNPANSDVSDQISEFSDSPNIPIFLVVPILSILPIFPTTIGEVGIIGESGKSGKLGKIGIIGICRILDNGRHTPSRRINYSTWNWNLYSTWESNLSLVFNFNGDKFGRVYCECHNGTYLLDFQGWPHISK